VKKLELKSFKIIQEVLRLSAKTLWVIKFSNFFTTFVRPWKRSDHHVLQRRFLKSY